MVEKIEKKKKTGHPSFYSSRAPHGISYEFVFVRGSPGTYTYTRVRYCPGPTLQRKTVIPAHLVALPFRRPGAVNHRGNRVFPALSTLREGKSDGKKINKKIILQDRSPTCLSRLHECPLHGFSLFRLENRSRCWTVFQPPLRPDITCSRP